jgi:regulatory protein
MEKQVSALTAQQRSNDRINVFLDGQYAFSLQLKAAAHLRVGQKLNPNDIERLLHEDECLRAYQKALGHLAGRPHSQSEIARFLMSKRFSQEAIDAAMLRLQQDGLVDDADFARFWTENRTAFRPRSARAIRFELRQKGVANEEIDAALVEVDDEEAAWAAIQPKLNAWSNLAPEEFNRKVQGFLGRRGFDFETVRATLQRIQREE